MKIMKTEYIFFPKIWKHLKKCRRSNNVTLLHYCICKFVYLYMQITKNTISKIDGLFKTINMLTLFTWYCL